MCLLNIFFLLQGVANLTEYDFEASDFVLSPYNRVGRLPFTRSSEMALLIWAGGSGDREDAGYEGQRICHAS